MARRNLFVFALWAAFFCRGVLHGITAPMWDGFDEPGHLAYILFIDEHGRPPGYSELSFPTVFINANRYLPSTVGHGAPTFVEWRRMTAAQRQRDRAFAAQLATNPQRYRVYTSGNYERQQGPLYYFLGAAALFFFRGVTLAKLLVRARLFSVALASLSVPIAARLLRLVGGDAALAIGLPLFALAPNTLFAFDRVTNEALALPLMTAAAVELVIVSGRPRDRDFILLALFTAAGLWTRITFLAVLPGIALALLLCRRRRPAGIAAAIALPVIAGALLLAWNRMGSGHLSGFIEQSGTTAITLADVRKAIHYLPLMTLAGDFVRNHLWCGGWGFLKPPDRVFVAVVAAFVAALLMVAVSIARRGWSAPPFRECWPLVAVMIAFAAALVVHLITAAIGAIKVPGSVTVGAGGWYLDEIRAMEVAVLASIGCAAATASQARRAGQVLIVACTVADLLGTLRLLLPRWGGYGGHPISLAVYRDALQAAPVVPPFALPIIVAAIWISSVVWSLNALPETPQQDGGLITAQPQAE